MGWGGGLGGTLHTGVSCRGGHFSDCRGERREAGVRDIHHFNEPQDSVTLTLRQKTQDGWTEDGGDVTTPRQIFLGLNWSQQHNSAKCPETDLFMAPKGPLALLEQTNNRDGKMTVFKRG